MNPLQGFYPYDYLMSAILKPLRGFANCNLTTKTRTLSATGKLPAGYAKAKKNFMNFRDSGNQMQNHR